MGIYSQHTGGYKTNMYVGGMIYPIPPFNKLLYGNKAQILLQDISGKIKSIATKKLDDWHLKVKTLIW